MFPSTAAFTPISRSHFTRLIFPFACASLRSLYFTSSVRFNRRGIHGVGARRQPVGSKSSIDNSFKKNDKDDYYALLLSSPLPLNTGPTATTGIAASDPSLAPDLSKRMPSAPVASRIVFGSRLAGPAARDKEGWAETRPAEPDNCCMSGCVNCVWDAYREEVEEWAARQMERQAQVRIDGGEVDGRRKEVNSGIGDLDGMRGGGGKYNVDPEEVFRDLPVGIKEFIATEKRLKERESIRSDGGGGNG